MPHSAKTTLPTLETTFDEHAVAIAKRQYFQESDDSLAAMFDRVANWVATPEQDGQAPHKHAEARQRFFDLMAKKRFCPGGRVLAGAATNHGNVLNCFVQDGSPEREGTTDWVLHLARKLALVTKVGGGNGVNLDPLPAKRPYTQQVGTLYISIAPEHADFAKVRDGRYMDLVRGEYLTKGYRFAKYLEQAQQASQQNILRVGDSVEGIWQAANQAVRILLEGQDVVLDLSDLRPEGTPVMGSGGNSSGPSSFAVEVFDNFGYWASLGGAEYAGAIATLRYVFAPTLRVIRQGGTRRGAGMATMSVTHPDIQDFITCKDLEREQAEGDISTFNISVLVDDSFMQAQSESQILRDIAEHAWQTGEPGLIFIDRINEHNPMRQSLGDIKSTNPCVTADTWVQTHMGARQVRDMLAEGFCSSLEGKQYRASSFWSTGVKPVFKVTTKRGYSLRLTANHQLKKVSKETRHVQESIWQKLEDFQIGDTLMLSNQRQIQPWAGTDTFAEGWLLGMLVGDGTFDNDRERAHLDFWGDNRDILAQRATAFLKKLTVADDIRIWRSESDNKIRLSSPELAKLAHNYGIQHDNKVITDAIEQASYFFYQGFLAGLFDADGSVQGTQAKGISIRLSQSNLDVLQRVQRMLARLGIMTTLYQNRRPAGKRPMPDGQGSNKLYAHKAQHELIISGDNLAEYADTVSFEHPDKVQKLRQSLQSYQRQLNRERFSDEIISIDAVGEEEVFDVSVEQIHAFDANGILAHNCGEIPLYAGEPCDLGAMNLSAYVRPATEGIAKGMEQFDFNTFADDVQTCVRFLDNVLEVNKFALEDNRLMSQRLRRLGLGVMGLADALIKMGYRYDSSAGRAAVQTIIAALRDNAHYASQELANERGTFPDFAQSGLLEKRRNIALLTVAPTGTTSMLMGVSSGVEPIFAPFIYRKIGDSYAALISPLFQELLEQHPAPSAYQKEGSWDWDKVVEKVSANHGSVQGLDFIPEAVKAVLVCAHDISPEDHVRMQGVVQRTFDADGHKLANSISKTINMPNSASVDDVFAAYKLAYEQSCKGITVYRDGSRQFQVLSTSKESSEENNEEQNTQNDAASAAVSPTGQSIKPRFDRPARLTGFTDAVKLTMPTGEKRGFYVTVNKQNDIPSEVFIISGKAGDEAHADAEALGRLTSIALQYGVPAEAIVKTLRGINGGMYGSYQGRMVGSKADIIAIALETAGVVNPDNLGVICPDCDAPLRFEEGCQKCESCGYSKCG